MFLFFYFKEIQFHYLIFFPFEIYVYIWFTNSFHYVAMMFLYGNLKDARRVFSLVNDSPQNHNYEIPPPAIMS
jgi:hypothetical protein